MGVEAKEQGLAVHVPIVPIWEESLSKEREAKLMPLERWDYKGVGARWWLLMLPGLSVGMAFFDGIG